MKRPAGLGVVFMIASAACDSSAPTGASATATIASAAVAGPTVNDPDLAVRTVVDGLTAPIGIAFLRHDDFLVTEKSTGQVKRVVRGEVASTVLDLPVNSFSERGLLGIALHPRFERNRWVYLFWTESSTGEDSVEPTEVGNAASRFPPGTPQPFGNRVDRFVWNPFAKRLVFDRNIVVLRAFQADADQPPAGNHNGGVIRFERDDDDDRRDRDDRWHRDRDRGRDERARLLVIVGDLGRRGQLQNLQDGPFGPGIPDDAFGGPEPDDAHLSGVVLRLADDGSIPRDNPFFDAGAAIGGEVGENLQKIFAYGIRNSFGLAVDPFTGELWESENGDDTFDEINRIEAGHNGGWIQAMGPLIRLSEFKGIETTFPPVALQQVRWPPSNISDSPIDARARMVDLPGSHYADPQFSWRFATAPAAIGFVADGSLGDEYRGDLFVGASVPALADGYLFRFELTPNRRRLVWSDPALADLVADNTAKFDGTESESILFGQGFGAATDIQTGPRGNVFVVSVSNGAVYEIHRRRSR